MSSVISREGIPNRKYLHSRNPITGPDSRENDIARDFTDHVANGPACLHIIQLVAVEAEIFFPVLC